MFPGLQRELEGEVNLEYAIFLAILLLWTLLSNTWYEMLNFFYIDVDVD